MKIRIVFFCLGLIALVAVSNVFAAEYTFNPAPSDLYDLVHGQYYKWGINWNQPAGEEIVGASILFSGLYNWANEADDKLYVHLIDRVNPGVHTFTDDQNPTDALKKGILLFQYTDVSDMVPEDYLWNFNAAQIDTFKTYSADGNFGLGFDPDCHYYNNGITFKINTRSVSPEPISSALFLLGGGAMVAGRLRRKKE